MMNQVTRNDQVCSNVLPASKTYAKTAYHPPNLKASKTHLRRPGANASDLNSFTDDTDSYDIIVSAEASQEVLTPKMRI